MSPTKPLALGLLILGVAARSAPAGPMASAQNLANAWRSGAPVGPRPDATASRQVPVGGLFLGVMGSDGESGGGSFDRRGSSPKVFNAPSPTSDAPTPVPAPASRWSPPSTPPKADAYINFGASPYAEADRLTTGSARPYSESPAFTRHYGEGGPSPADLADFQDEVVSTIRSTFDDAGLPIRLTTDPNVQAAHVLSVVSGTYYPGMPGAIGVTNVGNNGFTFLDKLGGVTGPDQLATAIGHNVAHELMHAFGIADHPEESGPYVDAASASLSTLADPDTSFSPTAAGLLSTLDFQAVGRSVAAGSRRVDGGQVLLGDASTVPEPSTIALWALAGGLVVAYRRRTVA